MRTVYVELNNTDKVIKCDTNKIYNGVLVEVGDDMTNDKLLSCYYIDKQLEFNEEDYKNRINLRKAQAELFSQKKADEKKLQDIEMKHRLASLTDKEAISVMSLFPVWNDKENYVKDDRVVYDDSLYKVLKDTEGNVSTPDTDASLYSVIK